LAARAFCISFFDYLYHYGTPVGDVRQAHNLSLPPALGLLMLNFNLHGVHHRDPRLPWWALPDTFRRQGGRYDDRYVTAAFRQLRGPVPLSTLPTHCSQGSVP
jgi:fatty acid desaturase